MRPHAAPPATPASLDETDLQLIQVLGEDGRRSYSELAQAFAMSESMVRRRMTTLVDNGYVFFATLVDPRALGFEIEALVLLRVNLGELEAIATALAARPEVRYLAATSGFSDLACEVILRSPEDLYEFSIGVLGGLRGIQRTVIAHELVTVKRAYMESSPSFWGEVSPVKRGQGEQLVKPQGGTRDHG